MLELSRHRTRLVAAGMLAVALVSVVPTTADAVPGASGPDGVPLTVPIAGSSPEWTVKARQIGLAPPGARRHLTVLLVKGRDHLDATEDRVAGWLRRGGLSIRSVHCGERVEADGTTAAINTIFHTQLGRFQTSAHALLVAPISDVLVPGGLRMVISTVVGLSDELAGPDISPMFRTVIPPSALACGNDPRRPTTDGSQLFPPHASDNL